jgi:hypothetical protein
MFKRLPCLVLQHDLLSCISTISRICKYLYPYFVVDLPDVGKHTHAMCLATEYVGRKCVSVIIALRRCTCDCCVCSLCLQSGYLMVEVSERMSFKLPCSFRKGGYTNLCLPIRVITRVRNCRLPDSGLGEVKTCTSETSLLPS